MDWPNRAGTSLVDTHLASPSKSLAALFFLTIILGGGGVAYGLVNLVAQLAALALIAANREASIQFWRGAPLVLKLLLVATLLLPMITLIPVPYDLWRELPGRELAGETISLFEIDGWRSASLDPARTMVALTGLIVPLALLAIGHAASRRLLVQLGWGIVAIGIANFLLGVPQVLSNGQSGLLYPENPMPGVLFGTFANRNSTGLFLVTCLILAILLPSLRSERWFLSLRVSTAAVLAVAVVLTNSRSSMALMAIPFFLAALHWMLQRSIRLPKLHILWLGIGALAVIVATALAVLPGSRAEQAFDRFAQIEDARTYIWEDTAYATQRYWPLGAGAGTFDEVFQTDESLENLTERKPGRAHNDYLEVAVEAGLPGLLLIAGWLFFIAWLSVKARLSPDRWIAWSGSAILLVIAAQSLVDYPLRNQAMLAVGTFALLLLFRFRAPREPSR